jgi:hypothetical protein
MERILPVDGISMKSDARAICDESNFKQFLYSTRYRVHGCEQVNAQVQYDEMCGWYLYDQSMPTLTEDMQLRGMLGEYVGSVSVPEISHFIYGGRPVTQRASQQGQHKYRVLFAEEFHVKSVLITLVYGAGALQGAIEVTVVTPRSDVIDAIKRTLIDCSRQSLSASVEFIATDLSTYLQSSSRSRKEFDFIEFNGGLSFDKATAEKNLQLMAGFLKPDGVIGITFFAKSVHQAAIHSMIERRIGDALIPLSQETARIVKMYFAMHNLPFHHVEKDLQLLRFLSHDIHDKIKWRATYESNTSSLFPAFVDRGTAFHVGEVEELVGRLGYTVNAIFPTAFSLPYQEVAEPKVLQMKSVGISEEDAAYSIFTVFRRSMYITKKEACVRGRIKPSIELFKKRGHEIRVVDRFSNLGTIFAGAGHMAFQQQPADFTSHSLFAANASGLQFLVSPQASPCMSLLSTRPTLADLHAFNKDFYKHLKSRFDEEFAIRELMDMLKKLISVNGITLQMEGEFESEQCSSEEPKASPRSVKATEVEVAVSSGRSSPQDVLPFTKNGQHLDTARVLKVEKVVKKMVGMGFPASIIVDTVRVSHPDMTVAQIEEFIGVTGDNRSPEPPAVDSGALKPPVTPPEPSSLPPADTGPTTSFGSLGSLSDVEQEKVVQLRSRGFDDTTVERALAADRANKSNQHVFFMEPTLPSVVPGMSTVVVSTEAEQHAQDASLFPAAFQTKLERMKSMGFPEAMIAEAIRTEKQKYHIEIKQPTKADLVKEATAYRGNGVISLIRSLDKDAVKKLGDDSDGGRPRSKVVDSDSTSSQPKVQPPRQEDSSVRTSSAQPLPTTGKDSVTPTAVSLEALSIPVQKKVARMREMGFPEQTIQELIETEIRKKTQLQSQAQAQQPLLREIKEPDRARFAAQVDTGNDNSALNDPQFQGKIQKMRGMGVPDSVIEQTILADKAVESKRKNAQSAKQISSESALPESNKGAQAPGMNPESSPKAEPLELKEAKMRAMGFPDHIIEAQLAAAKLKAAQNGNAVQNQRELEEATSDTARERAKTSAADSNNPTSSQQSKPLPQKSTVASGATELKRFDAAKVSRMRDMGFPDSLIEDLLLKEEKAQAKQQAAEIDRRPPPQDSVTAKRSEIQAKEAPKDSYKMYELNDRISDLTAMLTAAVAAKGNSPASGRTDSTDKRTQESKMEMLQELQNMADAKKKRKAEDPNGRASDAKEIDLAELQKIAALISGDKAQSIPGDASGNAAVSASDNPVVVGIIRDARAAVPMSTKFQTLAKLQASFRSTDCIQLGGTAAKANKLQCDQQIQTASAVTGTTSRRTANIMSVSFFKALFDLEQLHFIQQHVDLPPATQTIVRTVLPQYNKLLEYFSTNAVKSKRAVVQILFLKHIFCSILMNLYMQAGRLPQTLFDNILGNTNRLAYVEQESPEDPVVAMEALAYDGALLKLK